MRPAAIGTKRARLFRDLYIWEYDPEYGDGKSRFRARLRDPRLAAIAQATWPDHGVCQSCSAKAISGGRCCTCGHAHTTPPWTHPSLAGCYGSILREAAVRLGVTLPDEYRRTSVRTP